MSADRDRADHGRARPRRPTGSSGAQVEVLQRVDVVDGAGEQVAAAPPGQRGRAPGGRGSRRATAASGSARAQRGVVADEALGVAQRPAQEGEHLDRGQDARPGRRGRAAARRGRRRSPTRPAGRWWPRPSRQAEQARARRAGPTACPGSARTRRSGAPRPGSRRDRQRAGRPAPAASTTASKWGRRTGSWAATTTVRPASHGSMAGARRRHRRRVERRRRLVEQEDGCRAQQGAGQGDALALARAEREAVVADGRAEPAGQVGERARRAPRPRAPGRGRRRTRRARPRRRLSASVALNRWGRWGSQEK